MILTRSVILCLALVLVGCGITAPHRNPGYADLDGLSWRDVDAKVSLSVGPSVLRFAANFVASGRLAEHR